MNYLGVNDLCLYRFIYLLFGLYNVRGKLRGPLKAVKTQFKGNDYKTTPSPLSLNKPIIILQLLY